jgi:hypothetical protein
MPGPARRMVAIGGGRVDPMGGMGERAVPAASIPAESSGAGASLLSILSIASRTLRWSAAQVPDQRAIPS